MLNRTRAVTFQNVVALLADGATAQSLRVANGKVATIDASPQKGDVVVGGDGGLLLPGLVNAHDHLELNSFKRLKFRPQYTHAVQWFEDIEARLDSEPDLVGPRRLPLNDRLWMGIAKNLLSGVTTVCHHNPYYRLLRSRVKLRVVSKFSFQHSLFRNGEGCQEYRQSRPDWPWIIHLAEGTDLTAAAEFETLEAQDSLHPNTVLVHGVGLTAAQRQRLAGRGAGLVWCPGSNFFLFGRTACVRQLAQAGKLALGTDSRLTGEFDMLAELKMAHSTGQLNSRQLLNAITVWPARMLGLQNQSVGQLCTGGPADLILLPRAATLLDVSRAQLQLVMVGGKPVVASPGLAPLFQATRTRCVPVRLDGAPKLLDAALARNLRHSAAPEPGLEFPDG